MPSPHWPRLTFYFFLAAAIANIFSIAAGQVLLGLAVGSWIITWRRHGASPLKPLLLPLAVFVGWTLLAVALSPDPRAGLPQIRKFYVWIAVLLASASLPAWLFGRYFIGGWILAGTANAIYGITEYIQKRNEAYVKGVDFYLHYVANRITGFQSHWMTFSGVEMIVLLMLCSWIFFRRDSRYRLLQILAAVLMGVAIVLSDTRSVWIATAIAFTYLVANWRPKVVALLPVLAVVGYFVAPDNVQNRVQSIWRPKAADSNAHRYVTNVTGLEMIKAHPLVGVGPERVGKEFKTYVPASIEKLPEGYYGHLHSIYVHYAAERGLPAMLALVALVLKAIIDFTRGLKARLPDATGIRRALLHGGIAVCIAILIEGAFELNLGDSEVLALFLTVLALGYVAVEDRQEDQQQKENRHELERA
jgi:putative inorganic carbon (hco3(-)) transporter